MKPIVLTVLCFILMNTRGFAQPYWMELPSPTTQTLYQVTFLDSMNGWVSGDSGSIYRTRTGGQTWVKQETGLTTIIQDIFMLDSLHGWAVSPYIDQTTVETTLLTTRDGGANWLRQLVQGEQFNGLTFLDSLNGWMVGEDGVIYGSTDGGATWAEANYDTTYFPRWELWHVKFATSMLGFAIGGRWDIIGVVWRTTDGGQIWAATNAAAEPLYGLHFFDSLHMIAVGGDFDLGSGKVTTSDGGGSWEYEYLGIWGEARSLAFRTPREGWAPLGHARTFMFTADSGKTWRDYPVGVDSEMYDVVFPDSVHGYMVGNHGKVLKYVSSPVSVKEHEDPRIPFALRVSQNFPNPFNPSTVIPYELHEEGNVTITVYDIVGREVRRLREGNKQAGEHAVNFFADGLASGVYRYQVTVKTRRGTASSGRAMIILR